MKNFWHDYKLMILGSITGAFLVYVFSYLAFQNKVEVTQTNLEIKLGNVQTELRQLADLIGKGRTSDAILTIVNDCNAGERTRFEALLGNLDAGLRLAELKELDTLFSRCAATQSVRRGMMTLLFEEKIALHQILREERKTLGVYQDVDVTAEQLQALLMLEKGITQLSFDLVAHQKAIIHALLAGVRVDSEEANALRQRGQVIRAELVTYSEKASEIRETL